MPTRAKLYISTTVLAGLVVVASAILSWSNPDPGIYLIYMAAMIVSATWKVQLPGLTGTISPNFLFVIVGIAEFPFPQTLAAVFAGVAVQTFWRAKRRPNAVQVLFNLSCVSVTTAVAQSVFRQADVLFGGEASALVLRLVLTASVYYALNTALVSTVLCLVEAKPLRRIWQPCHLWAFPYYVLGGALATLVCLNGHAFDWKVSISILPAIYLGYTYYRTWAARSV